MCSRAFINAEPSAVSSRVATTPTSDYARLTRRLCIVTRDVQDNSHASATTRPRAHLVRVLAHSRETMLKGRRRTSSPTLPLSSFFLFPADRRWRSSKVDREEGSEGSWIVAASSVSTCRTGSRGGKRRRGKEEEDTSIYTRTADGDGGMVLVVVVALVLMVVVVVAAMDSG